MSCHPSAAGSGGRPCPAMALLDGGGSAAKSFARDRYGSAAWRPRAWKWCAIVSPCRRGTAKSTAGSTGLAGLSVAPGGAGSREGRRPLLRRWVCETAMASCEGGGGAKGEFEGGNSWRLRLREMRGTLTGLRGAASGHSEGGGPG